MPIAIDFLPSAVKDIDALPQRVAQNTVARIELYAEGAPSDIKKLKVRGELRLRVGDYRVLIVKTGNRATIHRILHRREAYR